MLHADRLRIGRGLPHAFTLVEVLTVLAIMGILTLVSMPYLVKSIRGNRLRVGTTTIVQAGRYARSMALLGQQEMQLAFDISQSSVRVEPRYGRVRSMDTVEPVADTNEAPARFPPTLNVTRTLDAVRIDYVDVKHQSRETTGTVVIIYRSNGRCTPYAVRLVDQFGSATLTRVDALSTPQTERDDR